MAGHVFVSYSRKDQDYARSLENDLRKRGFAVWLDDRIDYGDRWWRTIVRAVRACAAFIVVMTPDSEESEWVEREVQLALRERKPIFPLLLRGKEFPLLITTQYADVTAGQMPPQDFYDRLGQVLRALGVPIPKTSEVSGTSEVLPSPPARQPFEPEMILIPAGEFLMGSDPSVDKVVYGDEQPQHTLYLPDYYLAKTPVTNAQYAAFVQAADYEQPEHWKGGKPPKGKEDHPMVWVTWHDAVAYCNWLAETTGKPYRLPGEAEWEKGARGTDGLIYPWGNRWDAKRCNTPEGGKSGTTSVGAYPEGASPYGLLDMAGNVWEWTRSLYKEYPYRADDGRENPDAWGDRVVRGGSWDHDQNYARCACRDGYVPDDWLNCVGFRVAASPGSP